MPPTVEQLRTRLVRLAPNATPFAGVVYRSSSPRYATEDDLLTGEGSRQHGARWNPRGIALVYLSLTPETAMAETLAHNRYYNIPVEAAMPRTFVAVAVHLQSVLDVRDGKVRQVLRVSLSSMLNVDWRAEVRAGREPVTQMIGRAGHDAGIEGLIVPSAADRRGANLLVYPDRLLAASSMAIQQPEQLR